MHTVAIYDDLINELKFLIFRNQNLKKYDGVYLNSDNILQDELSALLYDDEGNFIAEVITKEYFRQKLLSMYYELIVIGCLP